MDRDSQDLGHAPSRRMRVLLIAVRGALLLILGALEVFLGLKGRKR